MGDERINGARDGKYGHDDRPRSQGFPASVDRLVRTWIAEGLLPAAVLDVTAGERLRFTKAYGAFRGADESVRPVSADTLFDAASLTKAAATLPAALLLVQAGAISLDGDVRSVLPRFRHAGVTVRHLLAHASGLPADLPHRPRGEARDVLTELYAADLAAPPGERPLYSDLGLILMGEIVAAASGEPLDRFAARRVFAPLGMADTRFALAPAERTRAASTERYDGRFIQGVVHDEKALHLGGVSGSAGLFTTAADLQRYARFWLSPEAGGNPLGLDPALMRECLRPQCGSRGLGWELWTGGGPAPACGPDWSPGSFGHTGFTGTSLWIDPHLGLSVVFLTNAVHFGRDNPIRALRPQLHSVIYSSVSEGE